MSNFPIPKFKDMSIADARKAGYDLVQLKFDGIFAHVVVSEGGQADIYSKTGKLKGTLRLQLDPGVYLGEYLRFTSWATRNRWHENLVLYDIYEDSCGEALNNAAYDTRWRLLRTSFRGTCLTTRLITSWPIEQAETIWRRYVAGAGFEGLVFRKRDGLLDATLARKKNERVTTCYITRCIEGAGKNSGMLGAFGYTFEPDGLEIGTVGSGMDDNTRIDFWQRRNELPGSEIEVKSYPGFADEPLRHPVFVRMKS